MEKAWPVLTSNFQTNYSRVCVSSRLDRMEESCPILPFYHTTLQHTTTHYNTPQHTTTQHTTTQHNTHITTHYTTTQDTTLHYTTLHLLHLSEHNILPSLRLETKFINASTLFYLYILSLQIINFFNINYQGNSVNN